MAAPTNGLGAFWAASAERVVHCCASISRGLWELLTSGRSNPLARALASALTGGVGRCSVVHTPSHLAALMANTLTLDAGAQPPVGVATPAKIEFFLGTPLLRMVIFPASRSPTFRTDDEDNVAWEDVVVRLGETTPENFTYTSTVGLASLSCDDSNFNFFADTSRVDADPLTAELLLHVPLGVSGDPGSLNRFSYHVQVLSDPIIGSVMGLIRWTDFFGTPSLAVLDGTTPMFTVEAGVTVETTTPGYVFRCRRSRPAPVRAGRDRRALRTAALGRRRRSVKAGARGVRLRRASILRRADRHDARGRPPMGYRRRPPRGTSHRMDQPDRCDLPRLLHGAHA